MSGQLTPQAVAALDQAIAAADQALDSMIKGYRGEAADHGTAAFVTMLDLLDDDPWTRRKLAIALTAALRRLS